MATHLNMIPLDQDAPEGSANLPDGRTAGQAPDSIFPHPMDGGAVTFEAASPGLRKSASDAVVAAERTGKAQRMAGAAADEMRILMAVMSKIMPVIRATEGSLLQAGAMAALFGDIAATTHSLALNAELQAGRPAEAGEVLKVMAQELRSLTRRSADAARGLPKIVEDASRELEQGAALAAAAGEAALGIDRRLHAIASQLETIVQSAGEHARAIREIETVVANLRQAAGSDQLAELPDNGSNR